MKELTLEAPNSEKQVKPQPSLTTEGNKFETQWLVLCNEDDLVINSGVCALLPDILSNGKTGKDASELQKPPYQSLVQEQVAIFTVNASKSSEKSHKIKVYVIANWDPIGEANVLYRGIIGSIDNEPMIASPLYKQHYSLITGICFEQADLKISTYEARLHNGKVEICLPSTCAD
jgi:nitrite reductase (NADH) small subunit